MIKTIEELTMNAWPSLQTRLYDGWVLRFANGYTKRSNSINPIYESTIDMDEKIDFCEEQYRARNLPIIFKLTAGSSPQDIDKRLEERGYAKIEDVSVRIMDLCRDDYHEPESVTIENRFSRNWLDGLFECTHIDKSVRATAEKIHDNIQGEVMCVSKIIDGKVVGCGFGAIERGYVGIFDIAVKKGHRGSGYGRDIMEGILGKAYKMGIGKAYLQVVVGNIPAENLYNKLGFSEVYRYWYRKLDI